MTSPSSISPLELLAEDAHGWRCNLLAGKMSDSGHWMIVGDGSRPPGERGMLIVLAILFLVASPAAVLVWASFQPGVVWSHLFVALLVWWVVIGGPMLVIDWYAPALRRRTAAKIGVVCECSERGAILCLIHRSIAYKREDIVRFRNLIGWVRHGKRGAGEVFYEHFCQTQLLLKSRDATGAFRVVPLASVGSKGAQLRAGIEQIAAELRVPVEEIQFKMNQAIDSADYYVRVRHPCGL